MRPHLASAYLSDAPPSRLLGRRTPASEGLNQGNGGRLAGNGGLHEGAPRRQGRRLCDDDVGVDDLAGLVLIEGNDLGRVGGGGGLLQESVLASHHEGGAEWVLHALEGGEHVLAIVRTRLIVSGAGRGRARPGQAGVEDDLRGRKPQAPDARRRAEELAE